MKAKNVYDYRINVIPFKEMKILFSLLGKKNQKLLHRYAFCKTGLFCAQHLAVRDKINYSLQEKLVAFNFGFSQFAYMRDP